jgi:hypothetical protein
MNTQQSLTSDDRSLIMMRGNMWAYNFLAFALLFDIMYRAMILGEAAWDLFALLFASGAISIVYAARHKALNRNNVMGMSLLALLAAIVAAVVAFAYTMTKAM